MNCFGRRVRDNRGAGARRKKKCYVIYPQYLSLWNMLTWKVKLAHAFSRSVFLLKEKKISQQIFTWRPPLLTHTHTHNSQKPLFLQSRNIFSLFFYFFICETIDSPPPTARKQRHVCWEPCLIRRTFTEGEIKMRGEWGRHVGCTSLSWAVGRLSYSQITGLHTLHNKTD